MFGRLRYRIRVMGPIGVVAMGVYRFGNFVFYRMKIPIIRQIAWIFYYVVDMLIVRIIAHAEISPVCNIGKNFKIVHGGNGVIISSGAHIMNNVTVYQQVTIGVINNKKGAPTIEDDVFIGAGAKVLGPIVVGKGAKIGANAVVLIDVPSNSTAVGVPARIINK